MKSQNQQKRNKDGRFMSNRGIGSVASLKKKVDNKNLKNRVIFVLDESGSMDYLESKVRETYMGLIKNLQENAAKHGQRTEVDLYSFSTQVRNIFNGKNVNSITSLSKNDYQISNSTSLFDAVGLAIETALKSEDFNDKDVSFLVLVLTDGQENSSQHYTSENKGHTVFKKSLNTLILNVMKTGRWTVTFQVPRGDKAKLVNELGLLDDCVREWEQNIAGLEETETKTSGGIDMYYAARSSGKKSLKSFFVQPDLSGKAKQVCKLDNLSNNYTLLEVKSEAIIKPFVESKVGTYVLGEAYYMLQKSEKVQAQKQVLIMDKFNKHIYGGYMARDLIGLPHHAEAKVEPGNHDKYDIFIQSTSVNRKLPRGTKVLVRN